MKLFKRIISGLLTIGMLAALIPAGTAFADDTAIEWTGSWTRAKNSITTESATEGVTAAAIGGGWQMSLTFSDDIVAQIGKMTTPSFVVTLAGSAQAQVWEGSGTSGTKVSTGTNSGEPISILDKTVSVYTFSATTTDTITNIKIYDATAAEVVKTYDLSPLTGTLYSDGKFVVSGTGDMKDFSSTNRPWYDDLASIKAIVIEEGVTSIGRYAFRDAANVEKVDIASTVTAIKNYAFYGCGTDATVFDIKGTVSTASVGSFTSVPGTIKVYNDTTFDAISARASSAIIMYMGELAASGEAGTSSTYTWNADTKTLTISGTGEITTKFAKYGGFAETVIIESGITSIGASVFSGLAAASVFDIKGEIASVGLSAFQNITAVIKVYNDTTFDTVSARAPSATIMYMGELAASGEAGTSSTYTWNADTKTLTISGTGEITTKFAKYGAYAETVIIESGITSIGASVFKGLSVASVIDIKGEITSVGSDAFQNVTASVKVYKSITFITINPYADNVIYCGERPLTGKAGDSATYKYDEASKTLTVSGTGELYSNEQAPDIYLFSGEAEKIVIEEGITFIGDKLFYGFSNATEIIIPSTVTVIGTASYCNTFYGCNNKSLVIELKSKGSLTLNNAFSGISSSATVNVYDVDVYRSEFMGKYFSCTVNFCGEGPTTGSFGDNFTWTWNNDTKTLTLSGTGDMPSATIDAVYFYANEIKKVVYESGITNTGYSYSAPWTNCKALESIKLGDTVKTINAYNLRGTAKYLEILCKDEVAFEDYSITNDSPFEKVVIHSSSIKCSSNAVTFAPATMTAYVINDTVKETLTTAGWVGTIVVNADMETVSKTTLSEKITESEKYIAEANKDLFDETQLKNFEALETALANAKAVNSSDSATQLEVDIEVNSLSEAYNNATGYVKTPAVFSISCENIGYGTVGGFKPTADITQGDGTIAYTLYTDEACQNKASYSYYSSNIPIGTYYIKGTMAESVSYSAAESTNVVKVEVLKNTVSNDVKTALSSAIKEANDFKRVSTEADYDSTAWDAVYRTRTGYLATAESIEAEIESGLYSDAAINTAIENLKTGLETLKNSPADTTEIQAEIIELIVKSASLNKDEYTEDSYSTLTTALENAKKLVSDNSAKKSALTSAKNSLESAIKDLVIDQVVLPAGEPLVYVQKKGKVAEIISMTADDSIVGATRVKVTFDCAPDVSYNPNSSIEISAIVNDYENYEKFTGKGTYTGGTTGWEEEVVFSAPISEGDSIDVTAFTYSWDNASDYVYAITKVEFLDEVGHILYTVTDKTLAEESLIEAIIKALEIDPENYTAESYAALTEAMEAAANLSDDASIAEIDAAREAIEAAIEALEVKPEPTKPSSATPAKTSATSAVKVPSVAKVKKVKAVSNKKKTVKVTWKKQKGVKGYSVQISNKKNFKKTLFKKTLNKNSKNITIKAKKLKSGKKYFVRVRAYKTYTDANGKVQKAWGSWSAKKSVKVK